MCVALHCLMCYPKCIFILLGKLRFSKHIPQRFTFAFMDSSISVLSFPKILPFLAFFKVLRFQPRNSGDQIKKVCWRQPMRNNLLTQIKAVLYAICSRRETLVYSDLYQKHHLRQMRLRQHNTKSVFLSLTKVKIMPDNQLIG